MRRTLPLFSAAIVALSGCAEHRIAGPPPAESTSRAFPGLEAPAPADPSLLPGAGPEAAASCAILPAPAEMTWIEAVRLERWSDAATRIDALPEADRLKPEMRYVRARAAIGAGDAARAIPLLSGLEPALPLLVDDITRWRAEAQIVVGPYAEGAAYFAKSTRPRDLSKAAIGYDKAGQIADARRYADLAVAAAAKSKSEREEARARMVRGQILKARFGDAAADPDFRWVAIHAPTSPDGRAAAAALAHMKRPLVPEEQARALAARAAPGGTEATVEIERAPKTPAAPKLDATHQRAMNLFKSRDYAEAAKAFQLAAKGPGKAGHEAEDWFFAARSLARSQQDDDAIKTYLTVATRYGRTSWGEKAQYQASRLYLQNGRVKEAAKAYAAYLATYKKGPSRGDAEYELALAQLSSGDAAEARKSLSEQAHRASGDDAAKLHELEGVAALRAGDPPAATAIWTEIARNAPFSWAALTSRARLASVGAPIPPLIEPALSGGAGRLTPKLPPAPLLLASIGLDGDAETRLLAGEREAAAPYAGREGEALCDLYGQLSRAKRRYRVGVNLVSAEYLKRAPSESDRWTWDCLFPRPFAAGVRPLESEHGLPPGLLHALMRQESAFDPSIVSPASAVGLMQLMPSTAKQAAGEMAIDYDPDRLTSPDFNLRVGAFYLNKLFKMFQSQVVLASAAYNAGPKAVSHWVVAGADNDVDLWVARIPYDETRIYVARVSQNLARYQWLSGGEAAVTPLPLTLPSDVKASADAY
ncbi:MAG: transglycosylase SLT domain-containing protein [Byssovorax sp.]